MTRACLSVRYCRWLLFDLAAQKEVLVKELVIADASSNSMSCKCCLHGSTAVSDSQSSHIDDQGTPRYHTENTENCDQRVLMPKAPINNTLRIVLILFSKYSSIVGPVSPDACELQAAAVH